MLFSKQELCWKRPFLIVCKMIYGWKNYKSDLSKNTVLDWDDKNPKILIMCLGHYYYWGGVSSSAYLRHNSIIIVEIIDNKAPSLYFRTRGCPVKTTESSLYSSNFHREKLIIRRLIVISAIFIICRNKTPA